MKKMTLKQFKETFMSKNSKWDWNKFSIVCNKCSSKRIEFNGWFESEGGYYGDHSLEGAIIVKCHDCGNAFKIDNWDADEFNINARNRVADVTFEINNRQEPKRIKNEN